MPSLVSPADVKKLVKTAMSDDDLQEVIDRVEAQIVQKIGIPQDDDHTVQVMKTLHGGTDSLFLPTEIHSIVSIVEDDVEVETDEYRVWGAGVIEHLPLNSNWGSVCVVTYKPADDRPKRKQVIIDLVRLVIERTAMKSENIAGEYSYTAPDNWDAEFRKSMRKLMFQAV
jgi:hypothetical protein